MLRNDRDRVRGNFNRDVDRMFNRRVPMLVVALMAALAAALTCWVMR